MSEQSIIYISTEPSNPQTVMHTAVLNYPDDGDVNGDGVLNVRDVLLLRLKTENISFPGDKASDFYKFAADLNFNGRLDYEDVQILRKMIVNSAAS